MQVVKEKNLLYQKAMKNQSSSQVASPQAEVYTDI